jgi:hypothetical protein
LICHSGMPGGGTLSTNAKSDNKEIKLFKALIKAGVNANLRKFDLHRL